MPHFGSIKWSGGKVKKNYEKSFAIGPVIKQNEKNYIQSIGDCAHWTPYNKVSIGPSGALLFYLIYICRGIKNSVYVNENLIYQLFLFEQIQKQIKE